MSEGKRVLVTGASSGIGLACALQLDDRGFEVYAGVRKAEDAEALREARSSLQPVMLDVTDGDSIAAVRDSLADSGDGALHGLVNNAGVYTASPLELMSSAEIRQIFEVNVIGLLEVSRALLPLLRRSGDARIVNIGSISGRVAMPGVSAYAASKHAVEALTDSLRLELERLGVHVSVIEPGGVRTEIWGKAQGADDERGSGDVDEEAGAAYRPLIDALAKMHGQRHLSSPEAVAEAVVGQLTSASPKRRMLVGLDAKALDKLAWLPDGVRDALVKKQIWD